jgi:electron transfer flavoprotein alpha/beta subunit
MEHGAETEVLERGSESDLAGHLGSAESYRALLSLIPAVVETEEPSGVLAGLRAATDADREAVPTMIARAIIGRPPVTEVGNGLRTARLT